MNYGRAFSFVTEDPDWIKKIVIGGLVFLIPVVGMLALMGWGLEVNRRIITGETELLPEWNDFGQFIINGLKELVVMIVYFLPVLVVYGCGFASIFGAGAVGSNTDMSSDTMGAILTGVMGCMYCFLFLFIVLGGLLLSPATSVLAETGEIGAALKVGHVFGVFRAAMGPYLISLLLVGLATSVASSLGSIACGVGALVATAYMLPVRHHLLAQAYKIAKANQSGAATSM